MENHPSALLAVVILLASALIALGMESGMWSNPTLQEMAGRFATCDSLTA